MSRPPTFTLAPHSFLRHVDARTKLALAASASAAVMLPLAPLVVFLAGFAGLLIAAGLSAAAAAQVRRLAPLLGLAVLAAGLSLLGTLIDTAWQYAVVRLVPPGLSGS